MVKELLITSVEEGLFTIFGSDPSFSTAKFSVFEEEANSFDA